MARENSYTKVLDGFEVKFTARRGHFDCDVSKDGVVVAELEYPRFGTLNSPLAAAEAFTAEAVRLAKDEMERGSL